jgi:hypothetical protein
MAKFLRKAERNGFKSYSWTENWGGFLDKNKYSSKSLCQRPHRGRLWIIQEMCLPSRLKVYCVSDSMGWYDFLQFWREGLAWYSAYCESRDRNRQPRDHQPSILSHHLTRLLAIGDLGGGTLQTSIYSSRLF